MLADPLNILDVAVVPIHLLVDGNGIIRYRNPSSRDLATFIKTDYTGGKKSLVPSGSEYKEADILAMKGAWDEALRIYDGLKDKGGRLHFRKGVVWRMKFDASDDPADFKKAVAEWSKAREINGAQYIWRRRIQQYGPQSDKPYPFYDWVAEADKTIRERGEEPVKLKVSLTASELASPRGKSAKILLDHEPDAKSEVKTDEGDFEVLPVILPATDGKKKVYRVHLLIKPKGKYAWNNEAGAVDVWLGESSAHVKGFSLPVNVKEATSVEVRDAEFEWLARDGKEINGYAVFHVCSKQDGICTILRKNFTIEVPK